MPVLNQKKPRVLRPKRSRAEQSGYLKRFHGKAPLAKVAPVETVESAAPASPGEVEGNPAPEPSPAPKPEVQEGAPTLTVVSRTPTAIVIEQRLVHRYGLGRPYVTLDLRLSTAVRGQRNLDGCLEVAYLFRLEVLQASPAIQVEGFSLGPWRAERVSMEEGNIFVADPLWAAFQAQTGRIRGRMLLLDAKRKCVLDLPWNTEALVPGPKPHVMR